MGAAVLALAPSASAAEPAPTVGDGEVFVTSATTLAEGQRLSFVGTGYAAGAATFQRVFGKIDDKYTGTANGGSANGTVGSWQVQGDGSFSGSIVVPADIDDVAVNADNAAGPHWLRVLGGAPATSQVSDFFTVTDSAASTPTATATAALTSGRGGSNVVVTVNATGFAAGEAVAVSKANDVDDTPLGTLTADTEGAIVAKTISVPLGTSLPAGEWQLIFHRADPNDPPVTAQITVAAAVAVAGAALDSDATVTVTNAQPGAVFGRVSFDPDTNPDTPNDVVVGTTPMTADTAGRATGTVHVPDGVANLGTKTFTVTQSFPYTAAYVGSVKISPSTALSGVDTYDRVESATGAVAEGLYQSSYSATQNALYATTAYQTDSAWDGLLYKLDPNTLAVLDSVRPGFVAGTTGARFAPYGVGVDDVNGTVWVTNTRQNTVAVYDAVTLDLLKQFESGTVTHSRDVVADPATGQVFVSSASEGSSGEGYISVFEAGDKDGDGTDFEKIGDYGQHLRTEFSPMSLELDSASHTLFTVSLTTQRAMVFDTETLEDHFVELPDLATGGRGASGVAYDPITNRLFVASQNSDELLIAQLNTDRTSATTVKEIGTGAGALNVAFDPVKRLLYVANFGGTTITVLDVDGNRVANLPFNRVNHVAEDGKGSVYAVNKDTGNKVIKLTPKSTTPVPTTPAPTTPAPTAPTAPATPITLAQPAVTKAGAAKVGGKAKLKLGDTSTWPADAKVSYQWKVGGKKVKGATKKALKLTKPMRGKKLVVVVTVTAPGVETLKFTTSFGKVK